MRRLLPALVGAAALAACGGAPGGPGDAARALEERLVAKALSVRSIDCVASGLVYQGAAAYRCTVNFGDPHLVPYCAALLGDGLATDRERPGLRCYRPEDEERYRDAALLGPSDG